MIKLVVASNHRGVIGSNGKMPWHSKIDLKWFREITLGNVVIMGKDTWKSIDQDLKRPGPLPDRINIILTANEYDTYKSKYERLSKNGQEDIWVCADLKEAILLAQGMYPDKDICIIGGEKVYLEGMHHADVVHHTVLEVEVVAGDRFFWPECESPDWELEKVIKDNEIMWHGSSQRPYHITHTVYNRKTKKTIIPPPQQNKDPDSDKATGKHEQIASALGKMVDEKNRQYGGSYQETETVLQLLYPKGIPTESYADFLCIMRIWDKMKRIGASGGKQDLGGEDARKDLLGIAIRLYEASR
jgi:dihydrofolate reductase